MATNQRALARWTILGYGFAALLVGATFSVWLHADKLASLYRHPDGSVSTSPDCTPTWTDAASGETTQVFVTRGRPLTRMEKVRIGAWESLPILIASALVGVFWGLVHVAIRGARGPATRNQDHLDYSDPPAQIIGRPGPGADSAGSLS
jgi:hypothetical protein